MYCAWRVTCGCRWLHPRRRDVSWRRVRVLSQRHAPVVPLDQHHRAAHASRANVLPRLHWPRRVIYHSSPRPRTSRFLRCRARAVLPSSVAPVGHVLRHRGCGRCRCQPYHRRRRRHHHMTITTATGSCCGRACDVQAPSPLVSVLVTDDAGYAAWAGSSEAATPNPGCPPLPPLPRPSAPLVPPNACRMIVVSLEYTRV